MYIREAFVWDFDVNKDRTVGIYWAKTADGRSGRIVLTSNVPNNVPVRLEVGTFMQGKYNPLSDTAGYYYSPK